MDRNWFLLIMFAVAGVALYASYPAFAQDDDSADESVAETADDPVKDITTAVGEIGEGITKVGEADTPHGKWLAIALIISAVLKILLSVLKLTGKAIFKNKYFLKIAPCVIGLLIFVFGSLAMDQPWYNVLLLSLGGPGAILGHELWKLVPLLQDKKG